jgi:hypothetical protein
METLTSYQLRSRADEHMQAVAATPGIDKFCSSLDWTLPAYEAFIPEHPLFLKASECGFVTMSRGFNPRIGRYLQPLEAAWCLASPFVGRDLDGLLEGFAQALSEPGVPWDLLYLSGIPPEGPLYEAILRAFGRRHRLGVGHETRRFVADIHDGMDAFLARRGSKTRHNLRRIARKAEEAGITYEYICAVEPQDVEALYARILRIEERSWKGQAGTGILAGGMHEFYGLMLPRLARRGALRVVFARRDEQDLAFIFGGLFDDTYRGLQVSFDDRMREWSPGNLMQLAMIERLMEEGLCRYDLGSELEYKTKWAEQVHVTTTLWVWRR